VALPVEGRVLGAGRTEGRVPGVKGRWDGVDGRVLDVEGQSRALPGFHFPFS